jgi:hypothetical protein
MVIKSRKLWLTGHVAKIEQDRSFKILPGLPTVKKRNIDDWTILDYTLKKPL